MTETYAVWFVPTEAFCADSPGKYHAKVVQAGMTRTDAEAMVAEQHSRPAVAAMRAYYGFKARL